MPENNINNTELTTLVHASSSNILQSLTQQSIEDAKKPIPLKVSARYTAGAIFAVLPLKLYYDNAYHLGHGNKSLSTTLALSASTTNFLFNLFADPKVIEYLAKSDWKTRLTSSTASAIISAPNFILEYSTGSPKNSIWNSTVVTIGIWFLNQLAFSSLKSDPFSQHMYYLWQSYGKDDFVRLSHAKDAVIAASKRAMIANLERELRCFISGDMPKIFDERHWLFKTGYYTTATAGLVATALSWMGYPLTSGLGLQQIMDMESPALGLTISFLCLIPNLYLGSIYGFEVAGGMFSSLTDLLSGVLNGKLNRAVFINSLHNKLKSLSATMLAVGIPMATLSWGAAVEVLQISLPALGIEENSFYFVFFKWCAIIGTIEFNLKIMPELADSIAQTIGFLGKFDETTTSDVMIQRTVKKLSQKIMAMPDNDAMDLINQTQKRAPTIRENEWEKDAAKLADSAPLANKDFNKILNYYGKFFAIEPSTLANELLPSPNP